MQFDLVISNIKLSLFWQVLELASRDSGNGWDCRVCDDKTRFEQKVHYESEGKPIDAKNV